MLQALGSFILKIMGWKLVGDFPKDVPKYIILGGSHTSNWDFILVVCVIWKARIKPTILGKKELFIPGLAWIFKALNVTPVDRKKNNNMVDAIAEAFNNNENMSIGIAPEGTRRKVDKLKTGFYHIAKKANIPLVFGVINGEQKRIEIHPPFYLTDDMEADMTIINKVYKETMGVILENSFGYKALS